MVRGLPCQFVGSRGEGKMIQYINCIKRRNIVKCRFHYSYNRSRLSTVARNRKIRLCAEGLPSTHWASLGT